MDRNGKPWDPASPYVYVCGKHFITGYHENDCQHPDYVPTIFPQRRQAEGTVKLRRYNNARKREVGAHHQVLPPKCAQTRLPTAPPEVSSCDDQLAEPTEGFSPAPPEASSIEPPGDCSPGDRPLSRSEEVAVAIEVANLRRERDQARTERDEARSKLQNWTKERLSAHAVRGNDRLCCALTGLSWTVFDCLHRYLAQFSKSPKVSGFSTEDQLFLCLLKLRQNPSNALLSHVLDRPEPTIRYMFRRWLNILYAKITFLIHWPDRECIRETIPPVMMVNFPRLTAIIDCFEIRIEYPKGLKARAKSYSSYKKWTTVKYLIACSPAGSITFLSQAWGGRASDVKITRECGFISPCYHHRGDQILADRGFTLKDDFSVLGVSLITPAFTRGKKQLTGKDNEESRIKSKVRIHVERVIGVLKRRFRILDGPLPRCFVKTLWDEVKERDVVTIDKIVHVCAALVNMSGSVVFNKNREGDV
ncbi:uncharacterized protein PAE49_023577 [Odontesthes bonariensis]